MTKKAIIIEITVLMVLCFSLFNCMATIPFTRVESVPQDKALVYVYGNPLGAPASTLTVYVFTDEEKFNEIENLGMAAVLSNDRGILEDKKYIPLLFEQGNNKIMFRYMLETYALVGTIQTDGYLITEIEVEAAKEYYLKVSWENDNLLDKMVDKTTGLKELADCNVGARIINGKGVVSENP